MEYKIDNSLTEQDILDLKTVYKALPSKLKVKRFYNLFYLLKTDIARSHLSEENNDRWAAIEKKLEAAAGGKTHSHYFLEYIPGSFTRKHSDDDEKIYKTAITLIEASDDLDGGKTVGYLPHWKKDYEFDVNWYDTGDHCDDGSTVIPDVIEQKVGETVWYDNKFMHSVSLVKKGKRIVLVSWFTK